jgi:Uma2 family endonuclease
MNVAFRKPMTVAQYLARAAEPGETRRSELINGQIVMMSPERVEHIEAKFAAVLALTNAIARARLPCHALADGATVQVDDHTAYEPDALVYCGQKLPRGSLIVPDPVIVVEVLSPTTAHTDTSAKLIGYFKLASVKHYLIIDPEARTVTHHTRARDGVLASRTLKAGSISLDPPGLTLEAGDLMG